MSDGGAALTLEGWGESKDGDFASHTVATLVSDGASGRYEWQLETTITCTARESQTLKQQKLKYGWIEYNQIYPSKTGECMLSAATKRYNSTLITDRHGVIWSFPHQHTMHYGQWRTTIPQAGKVNLLELAAGGMAGFFGETAGSPVIVIHEADLQPAWSICPMDYALHCGAVPTGDIKPGEQFHFRYTIKYLGAEESQKMLQAARPVPVSSEDRKRHEQPRFELGLNTFTQCAPIDRPDDASCFPQQSPQKVWDRQVGHKTPGSLRITNSQVEETLWLMAPPSHIPPQTTLRVRAMVKTQGVEGRGLFLRMKYYTTEYSSKWYPSEEIKYPIVLESKPVNGTTDGWVAIQVPELHVPREDDDYALCFEVVLDGKGVAWLTEVDMDLQAETGAPDHGHHHPEFLFAKRERLGEPLS